MKKLKWYHYSQNNSGGVFIENDYVAGDVLVQAYSEKEAWERMEPHFDNSGSCPCCGDRWSDWPSEYDEPMIYDEPIATAKARTFTDTAILHYYDGTIETVTLKD